MIRVLTLLVGASALIPQSPTPHRRPARRGPPTAMRGGGFLSNILGGKGEDAPIRDAAPTWDALRAKLTALQTPEESQAREVRDSGRGPPSAAADLRLFDAPDGTEPRVILYRDSAAWCPYCQKVWIQLEEKAIPYTIERINMRCYGDKPGWFQQATGGLLPVIRLDGKLITDSVTIMYALEEAFPENNPLLPPPGSALAKVVPPLLRLEQQFAGAWLGWLRAPGALDGRGRAQFEAVAANLEAALGERGGPYFLGAELSLVDLLFCSFVERAAASLLYFKGFALRRSAAYPNVERWFKAMETRPSYRASQSDYYTHAHDLPPQLGGCSSNGTPEAKAVQEEIDGGDWRLPLAADPSQPLPAWCAADAEAGWPAARREAAARLIENHEAVATFARRAHGPPGMPPVGAPLADPNNLSPVEWHAESVDVALRHVAQSLLEVADELEAFSSGLSAKPTAAALAYVRQRVGVPRDMSYPAARQFRAHLSEVMDRVEAAA